MSHLRPESLSELAKSFAKLRKRRVGPVLQDARGNLRSAKSKYETSQPWRPYRIGWQPDHGQAKHLDLAIASPAAAIRMPDVQDSSPYGSHFPALRFVQDVRNYVEDLIVRAAQRRVTSRLSADA